MGVTTMQSTTSITTRLRTDFPQFLFVDSDIYSWSPQANTIFLNVNSTDYEELLHEVAHGLLDHQTFKRDVELLAMERDAWSYAQNNLALKYLSHKIDDAIIQESLDSYRDWLHTRSTCPSCQASGLQTAKNTYNCLACNTTWKVNDARNCAVRRYTIK